MVAQGDLARAMEGRKTLTVDAGGGMILEISTGQGSWQQNLAIRADGSRIQELEGGRFIAFARLESGAATYWVVSEFSGGPHCCGRYYFFSRTEPGQPVAYLGLTEGHDGGPLPLEGAFISRQGRLFFKSLDNRFDYFHSSHAGCMLVNVPATFYLMTPTSLMIDNQPFKAVYLAEVKRVEGEIEQQAAGRQEKPRAILKPCFGSKFDQSVFADNLGQLLAERTILYLYAREDENAWQTLEAGVQQYYQTTQWLGELRREIQEKLAESPY